MLEIRFTFQACEDLSMVWDSIAADAGAWQATLLGDRSAADAFAARLRHHLELLAASPEMGLERNDLLHGLRSSALSRYTLFYRLRGQALELLRILVTPHGTGLGR